MDLAQAASIFKDSGNLKALGKCFNNIANIQYKNNQYHEAAQNFKKSIKRIQLLIENLSKGGAARIEENKAELEYFYKVHAHRYYQYAMSRYKLLRYQPDNVKDKRMNWQLVDYELR